MPNETTPKYTKDDFLNYKKLAQKFGLSPDEVYEIMRKHWNARTPIQYNVNGHTITNQMIVKKTNPTSTKRNTTITKGALLLHPMALDRFMEDLNKQKESR